MNRHWNSYLNRTLSRRELLRVSSAGFGSVALAGLLGEQQLRAAAAAGANPLAIKEPHFPARAKRVIFLFMHGGPSQVDTFDYKPELARLSGQPAPFVKPESDDGVRPKKIPPLRESPWKFAKHGQSGRWVSELFPHVAKHVDD